MRRRLVVLWLGMGMTACTYSIPLGGVAVGRGRPLGQDRLLVGASLGPFPEVAGALPALEDERGNEINPVPTSASPATTAGGFDPIGFSYGVTDRVDVGLSFSRGLHSFLQLAGDDLWSVTLSPAVYRRTSDDGGSGGFGTRSGGITNLNVSTLVSVFPPLLDYGRLELYGGAGLSRYSAWIRSQVGEVEGSATIPSVLAGVRTVRMREVRLRTGSGPYDLRLSLGLEAVGTWMTQRDERQDFVPTLRLFVGIGGTNR